MEKVVLNPKAITLGKYGAIGSLFAFLPAEAVRSPVWNGGALPITIITALWMIIYAIAYYLALTAGQNRYLNRPLVGTKEVFVSLAGGLLSGFLAGLIAEWFFQVVASSAASTMGVELVRILAWAIFGLLIGAGMSFVIPNIGRITSAVGGAAGGAIGAVGFIICSALAGHFFGRIAGMAAVGFALGASLSIVEQVVRTAFLEARYPGGEIIRVSLGADPVCVGGNSQRCAIWANGARAVALRFSVKNGDVICDDMSTEQSFCASAGFTQKVGNLIITVVLPDAGITVQSKNTAHPTAGQSNHELTAPKPPPPPKPPPKSFSSLERKPLRPHKSVEQLTKASTNPVGPKNTPPPPPPPPPPPRDG